MLLQLFILLLLIISIVLASLVLSKKEEFIGSKKKYFLAVVAIFKNENDYLEEWLDFYINQGVEQFYLYNNNDNAGNDKVTNAIFEKYKNKITHIIWNNIVPTPQYTVQRQAYQHCYDTFNADFQWVLLADIDEFAYSTEEGLNLKEVVLKYSTSNTPSIRIPRYNFGNNGHIKKPNGNVLSNYTRREKDFSSYKSISNVDFIDKNKQTEGVHRFQYLTNNNTINKHIKICMGFRCERMHDKIRISKQFSEIPLVMNHYYSKSYQEWLQRCLGWRNNTKPINIEGKRHSCSLNDFNKLNRNEIEDNIILKI